MFATTVDTVACPPSRRTFNPDGSRITPQTAEEKAREEKVFEEGRKRWGDRVGRRKTPPPQTPTQTSGIITNSPNSSTNQPADTNNERNQSIDSNLSGATLLPGQEGQGGERRGSLLKRMFHRDGEKKEKKPDAYIAAAMSMDGNVDGDVEVRRERLGRRG